MEVNLGIKKIREKNKLSQFELARRTGVLNQSQVSKLESGQRKIKVDELIILAKVLEVSIDELIK